MSEKISPGPLRGNPPPREAVCIHTKKVYDSCREKECLRDLRVYLVHTSQEILNDAVSVKPRSAELIWTYIDVEPITYNRGFFTVDVKYFYRVTCDVFNGLGRPRQVVGLATYDKRTILFGSEGSVRVFSSAYSGGEYSPQNAERSNMPIAVVEVVDPVCLSCKIVDAPAETPCMDIPADICSCFDEDLASVTESRQLYVTLGQFSIIRLERNVQLLMPAYDFCMPNKECAGGDCPEDPCSLFQNFKFPVDEFFPPQADESELFQPCCNCTPIQPRSEHDCCGNGNGGCGSLSRHR